MASDLRDRRIVIHRRSAWQLFELACAHDVADAVDAQRMLQQIGQRPVVEQ